MEARAFESILNNANCIGAFRIADQDMEPIKPTSAGPEALRTRGLWSAVGSAMSDAGLMIAKRSGGVSLASRKGGMIVEASGPLNIGILRAALNSADAVVPKLEVATSACATPSAKALWALAEWIDGIETRRDITIMAGQHSIRLAASQGAFTSLDKSTCAQIKTKLNDAAADDQPITLTYAEIENPDLSFEHKAINLFDAQTSKPSHWSFDWTGLPISHPENARLSDALEARGLCLHLIDWGQGDAFEVSVLTGLGKPYVIAKSNGDEIQLTFDQS